MIIDVRKLKFSGKEQEQFKFLYSAEDSIISLPNATFDGDVEVIGTVTLGGDKVVYVDGELKYNINAQCSRCLESINFQNIIEFSSSYVEQNPLDDDYTYKKGQVDLTEMVVEKLIMTFPSTVYCKEDCKGICLSCGANLNHEKCKCK